VTSTELIEAGVCRDLREVFDMFPLEMLDDYGPARTHAPSRLQHRAPATQPHVSVAVVADDKVVAEVEKGSRGKRRAADGDIWAVWGILDDAGASEARAGNGRGRQRVLRPAGATGVFCRIALR